MTVIFSPLLVIGLDNTFTDNKTEVKEVVDGLTQGSFNDVDKTLALLSWFDKGVGKEENFASIYHRERQKDIEILFNFGNRWYIFSKSPYFCCRGNDVMWVWCARCGRCGEASLLFNTMAYYAEIDVRRVRCLGEDHDWNEVNISGEWIALDATEVNLDNSTGWNLSRNFMEDKVKGEWSSLKNVSLEEGNVSYVYAEYPDDRPNEDITVRYTDTTNITVRCIDSNNQPLGNVTISIHSHNSAKEHLHERVILTKDTNETGQYTFTLGGGDYTFKAEKDNLSGEIRGSFSEDEPYHSVTIVLE
jgi:hypothetical protein